MTTVARTSQSMSSVPEPARTRERRETRWGPAWVGAVVALPVYVVLRLLFVAFGWVALGVDGSDAGTAADIVSALLGIIALFVGGLVGGAASSRAGTFVDAALQGAMTWALTAVAVLTLAAVGGLRALAVADGAARNGAGWAALFLGLAAIVAIAGTVLSASAGPRPGGPEALRRPRIARLGPTGDAGAAGVTTSAALLPDRSAVSAVSADQRLVGPVAVQPPRSPH